MFRLNLQFIYTTQLRQKKVGILPPIVRGMPDSFLFFMMNAFVTNFSKTGRMGTRNSTAKPGPPESLARKVRTDQAHSRGLGSKKSSGRCSCVFS